MFAAHININSSNESVNNVWLYTNNFTAPESK